MAGFTLSGSPTDLLSQANAFMSSNGTATPPGSPMALNFAGGSTDPSVFTTDSYIKNLNQNAYAQQANQGQAPGFTQGQFDQNWNQYMQNGSGFNPDAFNKAMGTQDVITPGWKPDSQLYPQQAQQPAPVQTPAQSNPMAGPGQASQPAPVQPGSPTTTQAPNPQASGQQNFLQQLAQLLGPQGAFGLGGGGFGNGLGGYGFGGIGNTFSPWMMGMGGGYGYGGGYGGFGGGGGYGFGGPQPPQQQQQIPFPGLMNPMFGGAGGLGGVMSMLNNVNNLQQMFQIGRQPSPYGAMNNPFQSLQGLYSPWGQSGGASPLMF